MKFNSNDSRTPSERIDGELLRRLIEQNNAIPGTPRGPRRNGHGVSEDGPSVPWSPVGGRGDVVDGTLRRGESGNGGNAVGGGLYGYPPAMVYAPIQSFGELYEPDEGLSQGTIFRQLDLPFTGKGGCRQ